MSDSGMLRRALRGLQKDGRRAARRGNAELRIAIGLEPEESMEEESGEHMMDEGEADDEEM